MKKALLAVAVVVVLLVVALAVVVTSFDVNRYHDRIQAALEQALGRSVQLGQMSYGLFPPSFKVQNAIIGEDPKFDSGKPFAQVAELKVIVKFWPLLHKQLQIERVELVRPQIELIRAADGNWNFSSIGARDKQAAPAAGESTPLSLDRFQLTDGTLALADREKQQPRVEYSHIDVGLSNYAPGQAFDVALVVHLPGPGNQLVKLAAHGGPIADATLITTPFEATLELSGVALSNARQYTSSQSLKSLEGSLGGSLKFKSDAGKVSTTGSLKIENVTSHGKPLGFPIALDLNASDDLRSDLVRLDGTRLSIGAAPFVVSGTINTKTVPGVADLKLDANNASVADLVKLAEAAGVSLSPGMNPTGQLSAALTARGRLAGPAVAGNIRLSQVAVSGVTAGSIKVTLNFAPFGEDVVRTLNGTLSVDLENGKLTGVDLGQKLGEIGKFTGAAKAASGATNVSQLTGTFNVKEGVATTTDLKAQTDAGSVAATGTISLMDEALNMQATAVLSKESSQAVGGTAIGGLMSTALTNKNGELVIPINVGGTIQSPKVTPDVAAMAKMKLNNLLPSFSNPGQLVKGAGGFLSNLTGKGASGQSSGTQNPLGALGGLFGKKKN